jgi:hypothetical protein
MTKFGLLITVENTATNTMNTVVVSYEDEYLANRAYVSLSEETAPSQVTYHVVKLY